MSDKTEKKNEERPAPQAAPAPNATEKKAPAGGGLLKSTPVLVAVVMILEGVILFAGFKFLGGGPKASHGAELAASEASADDTHGSSDKHGGGSAKPNPKKVVELSVLNFKAPNSLRGRTYLYDVNVFASVKAPNKEKVEAALKEREASIQDRIRTIIAQTDPEKLGGGSEPGLETLRRQVKYQLDELIGEGLIEEVLIPRCIPYRAEF